jgi:hypothetical protein
LDHGGGMPGPVIRYGCWSPRKAALYYAAAVFVFCMIAYISSMKTRRFEASTVLSLGTALFLCFLNRWYALEDLVHTVNGTTATLNDLDGWIKSWMV